MSTLTPGAPLSVNASSNTNASTTTATANPNLYTPYLTLVLPDTTVVSALSPRPASATPRPAASPVSSADEEEYLKHDFAHGQASDAGAGAAQRIDLERLKFRLVFILWPALVGITMAL